MGFHSTKINGNTLQEIHTVANSKTLTDFLQIKYTVSKYIISSINNWSAK